MIPKARANLNVEAIIIRDLRNAYDWITAIAASAIILGCIAVVGAAGSAGWGG